MSTADTALSSEALHQHNETLLHSGSGRDKQEPHIEDTVASLPKMRGAAAADKKSDGGSSVDRPGLQKQPSIKAMALVKRRISAWKSPNKSGLSLSSSSRDKFTPQQPAVKLENTFRTEPDGQKKFSIDKTKGAIEGGIKFYLANQTGYHGNKCSQISQLLSDDIKQRVKALGFTRYKLVVHVVIGQTMDQDLFVASRCIWDVKNDNMATVTYRNKDICATITVFATYFE